MKKLVVIDGNSLVNRAFYALPPLTASDGTPSQAVYGFATMLVRLIQEQKPDHFAVCFDMRAPTFRHKQYSEYKATRKGMPDELAVQLEPLKKMLRLMNITILECEGFEADDIIGSLVKSYKEKSIIVTGDRDSLQLVDENISVMLTKRGITEVQLLTKDNFVDAMGLEPYQIIEYKSLSGDSSDNIPGVKGIGDKTAMSLLTDYKTLDGIYQHIEDIKGAVQAKLIEGKEMAYLSRSLATIDTTMKLDCVDDSLSYDFPFSLKVKEYFRFLGFRSLLKRDELFVGDKSEVIGQASEPQKTYNVVKIEEIKTLREILASSYEVISFYYEKGFMFSIDGETTFEVAETVDLLSQGINFESALDCFREVLKSDTIKKLMFDVKLHKKLFNKFKVTVNNYEDIKLMQYLCDMTVDYSTIQSLTEFYGCNEGKAAALFDIYKSLGSELDKLEMKSLYYDIELPLIEILFDMEEAGFRIDIQKATELGNGFTKKMAQLTAQIHSLSGQIFNVNSPKQLADVLFNKMQIPYPLKTKNYSTSADILQEISSEHEIIDCILRYRTYFKLNNTYVDGLKKLATADGIVHTEFKQTLTTTGRLSSVEPNLQNIPIRDDEGKVLREIFVAGENKTLVSADYSQIELRLLAHYSQDSFLIQSYKNGEDIHTMVASEVFGVCKDEVTSGMRRDAKAVNFGIIYGISDFGLAKNLGISRYKAKEYIEKYFSRFSSVKQYQDTSVQSARDKGYAETLLGRKRKIPELYSSNFNIRSFGMRAAMNMPLQGTAADIVKIAMIKVYHALKGMRSRLILQIHDELIVEAHDDELDKVKNLLKKCMSEALTLSVPLDVDIKSGKRWSDC